MYRKPQYPDALISLLQQRPGLLCTIRPVDNLGDEHATFYQGRVAIGTFIVCDWQGYSLSAGLRVISDELHELAMHLAELGLSSD